MIIGLGIGGVLGLQATLLHIFNHALMKATLFMALAAIAYRIGATTLTAMQGLGRKMPWTSLGFVAGGLSLIGVPLTAGFVSKWYLVSAAALSGRWPLVFLILLGSLLAIVYIWRVVGALYFKPAADNAPVKEAPFAMLLALWLLVFSNIYFGIDTRLPVSISAEAAIALQEGRH